MAQRVWIRVTLGSESQEFKNKNHQATSSLTLSAPGAPYQSDPALGLQFSNNLGCEMKEFHCTVYVFVTVLLISIKLAFELAQSMFIFKQKGFFGGFFLHFANKITFLYSSLAETVCQYKRISLYHQDFHHPETPQSALTLPPSMLTHSICYFNDLFLK